MKIDPIVALSLVIIFVSIFVSNWANVYSSGFLVPNGETIDELTQQRTRADNYMQKYNFSSLAWYVALAGYLVLLSYWLYSKKKKV